MSSAPPASGANFATTHWSVVRAAGGDSLASAAALEQLCRAYWYPLYAFVRRLGHPAHDAQDLTQAFFAELFRKDYFRAADRERGKFRSFLLTALRHFLAHEWEKGQAAKRGGGVAPLSWDEQTAENTYRLEPTAATATPERMYDRTWALRVFQHSLERLRQESVQQGKELQFEQIKNYLTQEPGSGDYAAVATKLGLSPNAVAVAVHRSRQRYAALVRESVAETVAQAGQIEEELAYLISLVCD
jgi:RNA polymerase sigma factor (sigma-70 family)